MKSFPRSWLVVAGAFVVFPLLPGVGSSTIGAANLAASYALVAVSLVLLTGWVGQISLGHAAFVGIGAYGTGWIAGGIGLPFPLSTLPAAALGAFAAMVLGVVALRVRGLFLAVATLIFSWVTSEFLFRQRWFTKHDLIPGRVMGGESTFPSFDFSNRRTFFYVAWAIVACAVYLAANVRDSKTGRAFFAIRGSEMATASLGIDVTKYKFLAFALSGGLAGAAGNLVMSDSRAIVPDQFNFLVSLFFLSVAVVGGLRSLPGAVASAVFFAGLTELFFRVPTLGGYLEFVSAGLLALTLLAYPGGMAALGRALATRASRPGRLALPAAVTGALDRLPGALDGLAAVLRRFTARLARRKLQPAALLDLDLGDAHAADAAADRATDEAAATRMADVITLREPSVERGTSVPREERSVLLEAVNVTVQFGGLTAVRSASLQVRDGEVTGLIGPNGAGKTTLFNSIAGFVTPTEGSIHLYGVDVTALAVHERARLGVARTFQAIQLFPQLSVFENLLVATHLQNPTGVVAHMLASEQATEHEAAARRRVRRCLSLLELSGVADTRVADLPFGVLRMVEVARAVVTGFRLMMLDEPASGLDNTETDRLSDVIRFVRDLGVSVLLIEHDVRMVTAVSDYLYVLEQGEIIAAGPPEAVQHDPAVVAAYLGEPEPAGAA